MFIQFKISDYLRDIYNAVKILRYYWFLKPKVLKKLKEWYDFLRGA